MSDKVNQEALETIEWLETKYRESLDEIKRLRAALREIRDTEHTTALAYRLIAREALGDE